MIVVTTPTGQIGTALLAHLLGSQEHIRVIARDPSRLSAIGNSRMQVIQGSHDDPAVLDAALDGAGTLFWLIPPAAGAASAEEHYLKFARAGAEAIRRHRTERVVAISSAGHAWHERAGVLSAAFAMDEQIEKTGVAYRALCMPFFMENLFRQLGAIRDEGVFSLAYPADRALATVATRDIAATAAAFLGDRSWRGQERVPVFGPDRLTPRQMAQVLSDVLDRNVVFREQSIADVAATLRQRGASDGIVRDVTEAAAALRGGIYDADQARSTPQPTHFRSWCVEVLRPLVRS